MRCGNFNDFSWAFYHRGGKSLLRRATN
jgi:hypothetical protein